MNRRMIVYIIGCILTFEAVFIGLSGLVGTFFKEASAKYLYIGAGIALVCGLPFIIKKPENSNLHAKEGFVIVALGWIIMSIFGAIPFIISGYIPSFTDAVFEVASGFTTTGATILGNVEALSKCMLFWRSFTHWLGGMGVLVLIIAIIPSSGANHMHIMRAESPGPSVDKLVPRVKRTAFILYAIYFAMTIIEMVLLVVFGMGMFDAVCLSFGTAGTGGFGTRIDSIASYNSACQIIITIFMVLFGVNFKVYYLILAKKIKDALKTEEIRWYLGFYFAAVIGITLSIMGDVGNVFESIKIAAFQAASIMTTTGYATVDFNLWGTFPKTILVGLMFIGACAGSTGGGMKVSRLELYFKQMQREIYYMIHPRSVKSIKEDGKTVEQETLRSANVYLMSYLIIMTVSILIVSLDGFDFTSTTTAVIATLNNIGPGLEMVGPMGGFADFSILSKWVMIFDMIAGRLEIFPLLVLFAPATWKK